MVSKNTWVKGLNSDISKLKTSNETYLDALNLELITQDGNSSYALSNTKGTLLTFNLPSTGATYKLDNWEPTGFEISITTTAGIIDISIPLTGGESNADITALINDQLNSTEIICYYNANYLVIYDLNNLIISIADSAIDIQQWTYVSDTFVLGWDYSENNLILVTCDPDIVSFTPEELDILPGRLGAVGCVWVIPILNSTGQAINPNGSTVTQGSTLIANNFVRYKEFLNLSRQYNIYKSVESRKENKDVLRVIFTDYYNDVYTLNVLEDQVQATPVKLINILPANNSRQPIITEVVEGGFLPTGRYQLWYQLNSSQGAVSTTSTLSKFITIGGQDIITEYSGNVVGTNSGKSIRVTVQDIDTNYSFIRWGYTIYQINGLAESFYFGESIISGSEMSTVLNGNENDIPIADITELSNVNRPPSIAKTLAVVRNKLFIANTKTKVFDVKFDAKAFRFSGIGANNFTNASDRTAWAYQKGDPFLSPTTEINGASPVYPTTTKDFINPYNNENPSTLENPYAGGDWTNLAQFKYQADGATLGGSGVNLSYKFITKETLEDANSDVYKPGTNNITPVYSVSQNYDLGTNIQPIPSGFATMRSPYYDSLFWGYARGEVYRWAIVFKDLYGYDSFAYWIGDIKFPDAVEFPITEIVNGATVCYQLGVEFTLDTTTPEFQAIKDKISGWSYVRMERTTFDKTKLGTGMMDNLGLITDDVVGDAYCLTTFLTADTSITSGVNIVASQGKPIYIPSFQKNIDNEFKTKDYIRFLGAYNQRSQGSLVIPANSNYRNYELAPNIDTTTDREVVFKWSIESSKSRNYIPASFSEGLDLPFINMSAYNFVAANDGNYMSAGNKLDLITMPTALGVAVANNEAKYAISYERFLNNQYGGNTVASRYNNTYIYTGHFQSYKLDQSTSPSKVFGGDVVTLLYCYQVTEKNIPANTGYNDDTLNGNNRMALFFPTEAHGFNPHYLVYEPPYTEANRCYARDGIDKNILEESIPVNTSYNQINNTVIAISPPFRYNVLKEEPYTIYGTLNKIDGELIDSWRNFRTNNQLSVNGNYGPLNRLIEFKDKLFYYQESGVGIAAIDERVMISEGSSEQTQLGTGGILARYDYLSTETGTIHQFAVEKSGNSIYHYDALLNKAFRLADKMSPLSDEKGLIGKFNTFDKTIKDADTLALPTIKNIGVHIGFDSQRNKVYFTLKGLNQKVTYSFNELSNSFEGRHSFIPDMYINMRNYFISTGNHATIDLHNIGDYNSYYGVIAPSTVTFRNNLDTPDLVKVFDNLWINTEVIENGVLLNETITSLRAKNDYQDTGVLSTVNIIERLRTWRWNKLRNFTDKRRMFDKYIDVELTYLPVVTNKQFIIHDVIVENSQRSTIKPK